MKDEEREMTEPNDPAEAGRRNRTLLAGCVAIGLVVGSTTLYALGRHGGVKPPNVATPMAAPSDAGPQMASPPANNPLSADRVIPLAELEDVINIPEPATVEAVVAATREICAAQGTSDHPITRGMMIEMADSNITAYDAAAKRGFRRLPKDEACYRNAHDVLTSFAAEDAAAEADSETADEPQ